MENSTPVTKWLQNKRYFSEMFEKKKFSILIWLLTISPVAMGPGRGRGRELVHLKGGSNGKFSLPPLK